MIQRVRPWKNPVLIKEVRSRMRGTRVFMVITIHLFLLGILVMLAYFTFKSSLTSSTTLGERRLLGKAIFGLVIWMELIMVSFITPAMTSGSISTERESQTFDLLRVTLLPARSIVMGKFLSGLIFVLLLLSTSLPIQIPAFFFGGVLPEEILISTLILVVTAITFCTLGIFISCQLSRTLVSSVLTYAFAIFIVFGIPMIFLVALILLNTAGGETLNKLTPLTQSLLIFTGWVLISITPLATIITTEIILIDQHDIFLANIHLSNGANFTLLSPWIPYVLFNLLLSVILLLISVRSVNKISN